MPKKLDSRQEHAGMTIGEYAGMTVGQRIDSDSDPDARISIAASQRA
jgi:hypothetical protein